MKRQNSLKISLVAVVLAAPAPLQAQQVKFTADADFISTDSSGCITSEAFVFVRNGRTSQSREDARGRVEITLLQTEDCEDRTLLEARGNAQLRDGELSFDPELGSVTLDATVQMLEAVSKNPLSADVSLTWVAIEEPVTASTRFDLEAPGRVERRARPVTRVVRLAESSGSISDGRTNFTPEPSTDAAITSSR